MVLDHPEAWSSEQLQAGIVRDPIGITVWCHSMVTQYGTVVLKGEGGGKGVGETHGRSQELRQRYLAEGEKTNPISLPRL